MLLAFIQDGGTTLVGVILSFFLTFKDSGYSHERFSKNTQKIRLKGGGTAPSPSAPHSETPEPSQCEQRRNYKYQQAAVCACVVKVLAAAGLRLRTGGRGGGGKCVPEGGNTVIYRLLLTEERKFLFTMLPVRMKFLQLLCMKPGKLETLFQIPFCQKQFPFMCLATSTCLHSKNKKVNSYELVDQEKYNNLVSSVTSYKTSAQTPETIFEEDNFLYGPPKQHKRPVKAETKAPRNWVPLINPNKKIPLLNSDSNFPLKIPLQENNKTKIPSVTHILQQTISPQQAFYLERWKQKMILELGKDGFTEYTKNLFLQGHLFHATLESIFLSEEMVTKEQRDVTVSGYLSSVEHVLKDISEVRALESAVQHETLHYLGLVDCVAKYR
ncbi:mitochondrial genome maintenance exonuclease 1 isoform X2 [Pezoporus occidentalis]|uniref:mitochondrial genome maintenance exonuclease 1 isoform X2 n=1 Tax=Pezoporus occidentalis TaxID=407982 RepID=UPI002F90FEA9